MRSDYCERCVEVKGILFCANLLKFSGFLSTATSGLFQIGVYLDCAKRGVCDLLKFPPGFQRCCYCWCWETGVFFVIVWFIEADWPDSSGGNVVLLVF